MSNATLGLAPVPTGLRMDGGAQLAFTVILILPCVGFLAFALRRGWRDRDWLALAFFVGGALNVPSEGIVDVLGACWFPSHGQWTAITLLGRPLPVFLVVAYPWFIGGQGYVVYRMLQRGAGRVELWRWWAAVMVIDLLLVQTPGLSMGMYSYYGPQPGDVLGLPLHWLAVDAAAPMLSGVLVFRLRRYLSGWRQIALVPLLAGNYGLAHVWLSWPVWLAIAGRWPASVSWIATLASFALAATAVWAIITAGTADRSAPESGVIAEPAQQTSLEQLEPATRGVRNTLTAG